MESGFGGTGTVAGESKRWDIQVVPEGSGCLFALLWSSMSWISSLSSCSLSHGESQRNNTAQTTDAAMPNRCFRERASWKISCWLLGDKRELMGIIFKRDGFAAAL